MMEWVNPHSWIHIDVKGPDGTPVNWMIEGGSPNSLMRLGFTKNALLPDGRKLFLSDMVPGQETPKR